MPKLSVIVPVYNVEPYLRRCVDSIVGQTFSELEIILIDDGSTDGSTTICEEYASQEENIRVIRQENSGVSTARNRGLSEATGAYITFVDGDDWVESTMFSTLIRAMEEYSVPIAIGGYIDDYDGDTKLFFHPQKETVLSSDELIKEFFLQNLFMWTAYDKVYRRDFLHTIVFDSNLHIGEDMKFFWDVILRVKTAAYVPLYQYHYCHRLGSAIQQRFSTNNLDALKVKRAIWETTDTPLLKRYARLVYMGESAGVFRAILASETRNFYPIAYELQRETRKSVMKVFSCWRDNILTKRQRLGVLFMCLPFSWCQALRYLISKQHDNITT